MIESSVKAWIRPHLLQFTDKWNTQDMNIWKYDAPSAPKEDNGSTEEKKDTERNRKYITSQNLKFRTL